MPLNDIQEQLKQLQQEEARIAERKAALEAEMKRQSELDAKLDDLVKKSGFGGPRELVLALIDKYNLRMGGRNAAAAEKPARRKRTKITAELRDSIKKELNENNSSMNAVSKQYGISYAVVAKIKNGSYDNL